MGGFSRVFLYVHQRTNRVTIVLYKLPWKGLDLGTWETSRRGGVRLHRLQKMVVPSSSTSNSGWRHKGAPKNMGVKFHCSNCQSPQWFTSTIVTKLCIAHSLHCFPLDSIVFRLKALRSILYTDTMVALWSTWYNSIVINTVPCFHCRCN